MVYGVLERPSASDVAKRFGYYYDEAMTRPFAVERNGAADVVMMPAAEYGRLARLDHVALRPNELDQVDLAAIRSAAVADSAMELDHLLE